MRHRARASPAALGNLVASYRKFLESVEHRAKLDVDADLMKAVAEARENFSAFSKTPHPDVPAVPSRVRQATPIPRAARKRAGVARLKTRPSTMNRIIDVLLLRKKKK